MGGSLKGGAQARSVRFGARGEARAMHPALVFRFGRKGWRAGRRNTVHDGEILT
jgi:hypothetical protein